MIKNRIDQFLFSLFPNWQPQKHQGDTLQNAVPPLNLNKLEERIIKMSADGRISKQAITQENTLLFKDRETKISAAL